MIIYVIGSLRNPYVPLLADELRAAGHEVFDDWFSAGPRADDHWQEYERSRGHSFSQALKGYAAQHVFKFDQHHLHRADAVVLVMPAGKSGHMEFGYAMGLGKPGFILMDGEPERFDVMYAFATDVVNSATELLNALRQCKARLEGRRRQRREYYQRHKEAVKAYNREYAKRVKPRQTQKTKDNA